MWHCDFKILGGFELPLSDLPVLLCCVEYLIPILLHSSLGWEIGKNLLSTQQHHCLHIFISYYVHNYFQNHPVTSLPSSCHTDISFHDQEGVPRTHFILNRFLLFEHGHPPSQLFSTPPTEMLCHTNYHSGNQTLEFNLCYCDSQEIRHRTFRSLEISTFGKMAFWTVSSGV